jgi:adenine phosphoribosyltransferase
VALIQKLGGIVMGCAFVIDLPDLGGTKRLAENKLKPFALCEFSGD